MRKTIILAVALVAFVAVPAFASVQNVRVSGDVDSTYIYRENFDLNNDTREEQSTFITQTRLRVDADLTDQVSATIALINERPWEHDPGSTASGVDLNLAYVTIREMLYSPLTVIIGRQDFRFGNSFIFDTAGQNNDGPTDSGITGVADDLTKQTAQDAIRVILDYNPLTITGFFTQASRTQTIVDTDDAVNIWGLVVAYELGDEMDSLIEAYIFDRKDKSSLTGTVDNQLDHLKIIGARVSTNPLEGLNVQGELAHQGGTIVDRPTTDLEQERDSWGMQFIANYQVPMFEDYDPTLQYVFTKVYGADVGTSGGGTDDEHTGWDAFFENQSGGKIYNTLFDLTNIVAHEVTATVTPMEDVIASVSVTKLWTHQRVDSSGFTLFGPDGTDNPLGAGELDFFNRELGTEVDAEVTYDYTEDVQFGLNIGVFKPAELFISDVSAKQVLANVSVAF